MASGVKTSDAIAVKQNESWAAYTRLSSQEATIASQGRLSGTCRADPLVMAVAGGVCTLRRLAVQGGMTSLLLVASTITLLELLESGASLIPGNIPVKILEIASLGYTK